MHALLLPAAGALVALALAMHTDREAAGAAVIAIGQGAPAALLWLAAAGGLGRLLRRWLIPHAEGLAGTSLAFGLGAAALLMLSNGWGRFGLLDHGVIAWAALIVPACLLALPPWPRPQWRVPILNAALVPPAAVLLIAALSAPGWLWSSEFGGYDVLSYHLRLADEWRAAGAVIPLEYCVYSFLPSGMEIAYYHLAVLHGGAADAAVSCQLLHAALTLGAAAATGALAARLTQSSVLGIAGAVVLLGTPWAIVTGSLAYNEMTVVLMLAAGWLAIETSETPGRTGFALGLLIAAAIAAKPTAAFMVGLPLGVLWIIRLARLRPAPVAFTGGVAGLGLAGVLLVPWLISGALHGANPFFPFALDLFGSMHWLPEDVARWTAGHRSSPSITAFWNQFLRYGIGPAPSTGPWTPLWSLVPWALIAAFASAPLLGKRRQRLAAPAWIILAGLAFWFLATHQQSRFLVPLLVPATIAIVIAASAIRTRGVLAVVLIAHAFLPAVLYLRERGGQPALGIGAAPSFSGASVDALLSVTTDPAEREAIFAAAPAAWWVNYGLPDDAVVALIGDAAPLYYDHPNLTWSTTWDRAAGDAYDQIMSGIHGYTHVLVDETMLRIWAESGWIDPRLTAVDEVLESLSDAGRLVSSFPDGKILIELTRP